MISKKLVSLIGAGVFGLGAFLYNPVKGVTKAIDGQNVDLEDVSFFLEGNFSSMFMSWDDVAVVSDYVKLPGEVVEETILYEQTPTKERLSHRVFDGYAMSGMSPDNFIFERGYGEEKWRLTWAHPYRNDKNSSFEEIASMINGQPAYATVKDRQGKEQEIYVGSFTMSTDSNKSLDEVVKLSRQYFNVDLSGYQRDI